MATKTAILAVKIVSDAKDFSKGMDDSVSKLDKFKSAASKMTVPATAIVAGIGAIAVSAGKMASEAQQNFGAVDAVFKDHANAVKDMAKTAANTLGLSASDYTKYSALLGSQLKNAGVPLDQLGTQTNKLIGYGADFAAQFGGTVPEAVEALSSALKGEMDPIERYGISLNQAKIDAEASALGFQKVGGAWEESAKQAAIMSLIAKQGGDAMGAFGREAETAAGMQARATAAWENASAQLGTALLPFMTQAAQVLSEVATWVQQNQGLVTGLAVVIASLAAGILVLNGVMMIMNIIAALNPFVIIAVAVAALIAVIVYLATQTTFFQTVWANMCANAKAQFGPVVEFIKSAWNGTVSFLTSTLGNIGNTFSNIFNGARNVAVGVISAIAGAFGNIVSAVSNAISWVSRLFNGFSIPGWLRSVMSFMGVGGTGFDITGDFAAFAAVPGEMGIGATGGMSMGSILGGGSTTVAPEVNYNITVNGALDPDAVGRQVVDLIKRHERNTGVRSAAGGF